MVKAIRLFLCLFICVMILAACGGGGESASDELKAAISAAQADDTLSPLGSVTSASFAPIRDAFAAIEYPRCCGVVDSGENPSTAKDVKLEIILDTEQSNELGTAEDLLITILQFFNPTGTETVSFNLVPFSVKPQKWIFNFKDQKWKKG